MDEYTREFVQESEENITQLNNSLLELERGANDRESMDEVFRMAHTLKGNCGAMGYDGASDLAHAIEDRLDDIRAGRLDPTADLMDEIFDAVDELEAMVDEVRNYGAPERDPTETIDNLHSLAPEDVLTPPSDSEIDAVVEAADFPEDEHNVYHVRLDVKPAESVNNGRRVVEALIDAFDLLGTVPDRDSIDSGEYEGELDAVFGTAVTEEAISNALEPVDPVSDLVIVDVTDRFETDTAPDMSAQSDAAAPSGADEIGPADDEVEDMSVDELLGEFEDYDDLDEMVEHVEDAKGLDELGDHGTFDGVEVELDVDAPDPLAEAEDGGMQTAPDASKESATAEPPTATQTEEDTAESEPSEEEAVVGDASETFKELQEEVDSVGFDELQNELQDLEFDQYDQEEEVGFDELLSKEELEDEEFDPFGGSLEEEAETAEQAAGSASEPAIDQAEVTSEAQIEEVDPEALIEEETEAESTLDEPETAADVAEPEETVADSGTAMDFETGEVGGEEEPGDGSSPDEESIGTGDAFADDLFGGSEPAEGQTSEEPETAEAPDEPEMAEAPEEPEKAEAPEEPESAEGPEVPETAEATDESETAEAPDEPESVEAPEEPETVEAPNEPETVEGPEVPETAQAPEEPESVEAPDEPETAKAPDEPETVEGPEEPETAEAADGPESVEAPEVPETAEAPEEPETVEAPDEPESVEGPEVPETAEATDEPESVEGPDEPETVAEAQSTEGVETASDSTEFEPDVDIDTGEEVAFDKGYDEFEEMSASGTIPESSSPSAESESPSMADRESSPTLDVESDLGDAEDFSPDVELEPTEDVSGSISTEEPGELDEVPSGSAPSSDEAGETAFPSEETGPAEASQAGQETGTVEIPDSPDKTEFEEKVETDLESVDFDSVDTTVEFGPTESTTESVSDEQSSRDVQSAESGDSAEELGGVEVGEFDLDDQEGASGDDIAAEDLSAEIEQADEAFADLDLEDSGSEPDFDGLDRDFGASSSAGMRSDSEAPFPSEEAIPDQAGPGLPIEVSSETDALPDRDVDLKDLVPTPPEEMVGADGEDSDEPQSVRIEIDRVDDLLNLVEGLVTTRARLRRAVESGESLAAIDQEIDDLEDLVGDLQDTVMDVRLVPLSTVANRLPRTVRDIARDQNKQVSFEMEGGDVEIDRSILDDIDDPLMHLVRNAVDHGIEPPEEREAADKDPEGTVTLSARRRRDRVVIEVEDDGRGLDPDRLRTEAVEQGILTRDEAESLSDEETYDLVFESGFSTNQDVTDVSGRGVGMDVVSTTVEDLDGAVTVESERGEGTTVRMRLPVSVAISDVLFVRSGEEEFGVPLKAVEEIGGMGSVDIGDGQEQLVDGDERYPLVRLADALETRGVTRNGDGMTVKLRKDVRQIAIHCDEVRGQQEVVVRPFEGVLGDIPGLSGATVLGEGDVVNILDVNTL